MLLVLLIVAAFHCNFSFFCNGFTTSSAAATSQKQYALQTTSSSSSKSALQVVLIHDNSMHTALSNFLPSSSTIATPSPSSYSEWNTPSTNNNNNNDIITNWLKTSATVDIFSTQASPSPLALPDDATAEYEDTIIPVTPPTTASSTSSSSTTIIASSSSSSSKYRELTTDEISTLQLAFSTFYNSGSGNRQENVMKSYELFTNAIHIWESTEQSGDEIAGLFRVRGDVNMVRTVILYVCFDTIVVQ